MATLVELQGWLAEALAARSALVNGTRITGLTTSSGVGSRQFSYASVTLDDLNRIIAGLNADIARAGATRPSSITRIFQSGTGYGT